MTPTGGIGVQIDPHEVSWPDTPFPLSKALVLAGKRGSEAHGTYVPPEDPDGIDDRDIMGVCVLDRSYYLGLDTWNHAEAIKGPWDVVLYDIRKFVGLLCQQNPNVLSMLYLEPEDYLVSTAEGCYLRSARQLFRHRTRAFESFMGYANGQLKRMTSFGQFRGYMGAKRKALVEQHGWDTKNGAHLVRLLRLGHEYLSTGSMRVRREPFEVEMLLAIKRGHVPLVEVQKMAEAWFIACRNAYEVSPLPTEIDRTKVNRLLEDIIQGHWGADGT